VPHEGKPDICPSSRLLGCEDKIEEIHQILTIQIRIFKIVFLLDYSRAVSKKELECKLTSKFSSYLSALVTIMLHLY
jgi:hypothetical protein